MQFFKNKQWMKWALIIGVLILVIVLTVIMRRPDYSGQTAYQVQTGSSSIGTQQQASPGNGLYPTPNWDPNLGYDPTAAVGTTYGPSRLTNSQCNAVCKGKCGSRLLRRNRDCWDNCRTDVCHH